MREHNQYGSREVSEVITSIQEAADPEHLKRLIKYRAENDAMRAEFKERDKKTLDLASTMMREQEASRGLIAAVLAFHEGMGSIWDVSKYLPGGSMEDAIELGEQLRAGKREKEEARWRQAGNIIPGPWETAG